MLEFRTTSWTKSSWLMMPAAIGQSSLRGNSAFAHIIVHERNRGYGGNQKTCYARALELGADIVVMLHPDYQYTPKLIAPMASIIAAGIYPVVLGSRILGKGARKGGMPLYKYIANRAPYVSGERAHRSQTLRVPHRLPCL